MSFRKHLTEGLLLIGLMGLLACPGTSATTGIRPTPPGSGPLVDWDPLHRPLPEIPLPNDAATWPDPTSPTGRRINASMVGPTDKESRVRRLLDRVDGWGVYAPLWVSFDKRLDLDNIRARHARDGDFTDDAFYLINIDPDSPDYGKASLLDVGWGNFPITLEDTDRFARDPRANGSNLLYETYDETVDGIDTNFDHEISEANVDPPGGDPYDDLLTFYELATETLIFRPLLPLREQTEYAVVLTERLVGQDGEPIRSPFDYVNHASQTESLGRLESDGLLDALGLSLDDVAFAWSFTTQSVTADLVALRQGLDGNGTFGWLADAYPAELATIDPLKDDVVDGSPVHIAEGARFAALFEDHGPDLLGIDGSALTLVVDSMAHIDYFVAGTFDTPNFLDNKDEVFNIDRLEGTGDVGHESVTWWMSVPKAGNGFEAPFPVVFLLHGHTSSRLDILNFSGMINRFGYAVVGIDAVGHGGGFDPADVGAVKIVLGQYGLNAFVDSVLAKGRARDLSGDGTPDSGADYWTDDPFHTRDVVRQTALDHFQLTRIFRSWDGEKRWDFDLDSDGELDIAGDFNGDGVPDVGGPWNHYAMMGGSLGGIVTGVVAPVEPYMEVAVPISGGAGLGDMALRTERGSVQAAMLMNIFGPFVQTHPDEAGTGTTLSFMVGNATDVEEIVIADLPEAEPGDHLEVINRSKGTYQYGSLDSSRSVRVNLPCDLGDELTIVLWDNNPRTEKRRVNTYEITTAFKGKSIAGGTPLTAPVSGLGEKRQTPQLRRLLNFVAMVLEPGDPAGYGRHMFEEPLDVLPDGGRPTNVLFIPSIGDMTVPTQTGIAMARITGVVPVDAAQASDPSYRFGRSTLTVAQAGGFETWFASRPSWGTWMTNNAVAEPTSPNDVLVDNYVIEGLEKLRRFNDAEILFDPDDLDNDTDGFAAPSMLEPLRITRRRTHGISALRVAYASPTGSHGFGFFDPDAPFDIGTYLMGYVGHYIRTQGRELIEDPCLEDLSCGFLPAQLPRSPRPSDVPPGP